MVRNQSRVARGPRLGPTRRSAAWLLVAAGWALICFGLAGWVNVWAGLIAGGAGLTTVGLFAVDVDRRQ